MFGNRDAGKPGMLPVGHNVKIMGAAFLWLTRLVSLAKLENILFPCSFVVPVVSLWFEVI